MFEKLLIGVLARLIASFIGMDVLLGADLEKGLAGVKAVAETPHQK